MSTLRTDVKELSFNKFPISVHPELVEGSCHRTSTSSVRTESGNENREVISRQLLRANHPSSLLAMLSTAAGYCTSMSSLEPTLRPRSLTRPSFKP